MSDTPAIFDAPPVPEVRGALVRRLGARLEPLSDARISEALADTVYTERLRFEDHAGSEEEEARVDRAARAIASGAREAMVAAAEDLVGSYAEEIHNRFSQRTYRAATKLLPRALVNLVSARHPERLLAGDLDPDSRIRIQGAVEQITALTRRGTVIVAPTHLSNLDSPLIGYAIYRCGLPPVAYGAGLNLFSNPAMAFFMSRLGAYTVDRRKQGQLYKDALKDYSVELLRRGVHSLFFPGGTRSRSGQVEKAVKKGLLGTGIQAWQENLAAGRGGDIFVVPMTLSTSLVLEAETLIRDALAREGKARYIIADDEFSQPRTVASFLSRVLNLDESVHLTFSRALDLMGNPVDDEGNSLGPDGRIIDRARYVCDASGTVEPDPQRDRVYTNRLADGIVDAFHRDNVALTTHVAAFSAWQLVQRANPGQDQFRLVRMERSQRVVNRDSLLREIDRVVARLNELEACGRIRTSLPGDAEAILERAVMRFGSFHTRPALEAFRGGGQGQQLRIDPELLLFYRNRLVGYDLERGGEA
ncbi:MAG: 1-acyl-sn-glycerol-3-phosphate acyltransferase [Alphaproteobacteria bacterium]|nr:1-acyl-sn-glycerol-3-phosphate acyltransferase [Alphaproteobacteria bacterium]